MAGTAGVANAGEGARLDGSNRDARRAVDEVLTRETAFRRLLGAADALAVSIGLLLGAIVIGGDALTPGAFAVPPLFILVAKAMGLYDRDARLLHKTTLDELPKLFGLATLTTLLVWLADGAVINGEIGRAQVAGSWGLLLVGLIVLRSLARAAGTALTSLERCLFVGTEAAAGELREKLATSHAVKAELVAWLPADAVEDFDGSGLPLAERIRGAVAEHDVHRVVVGPGPARSDQLLDTIRRMKDNRLKVSVLPDIARVVNSSVELDRLNGLNLLGVQRYEITQSSRIIKRSFDLAGSALALVVLSPVLLAIAIAIRLDSPGPVLYRQRRAGRHGEPFQMLKFRSMIEGAEEQLEELLPRNEADGVFKMADDPRITRIGRAIRQVHLDELPQLANVLSGKMSLVGPRPLPLEEDRRIEGWHRRRLEIRPGITGPWQVLGSSRIPVREMVKLDYQYVADWSLWNDIRILLLTLSHVARRGGL